VALLLAATCLLPAVAFAAEFRMRAECPCRGPVVTLGDVAEVLTADSEQARSLAAIELFASPPPGGQRFLRLRELQDLLLGRGVNLAEHIFSGYGQTVVLGPAPAPGTDENRPVGSQAVQRAQRQVAEAVVRYLRQYVSATEPWTASVALDDRQARLLAGTVRGLSVHGGSPPWTGGQRFAVSIDAEDGPRRLEVDAQVGVQPAVVVAVRSLSRGAVVRPEDVQLQSAEGAGPPEGVFHAVDDVIGKETLRAVPVGAIFEAAGVRAPLLVRRGEAVTVYARAAGIRVRTTARAREDGALGDPVDVESLFDRKTYQARVCGFQEVEVDTPQAGRRTRDEG